MGLTSEMDPLIAIVTPTFNRAKLLRGNIRSVLSQRDTRIQHIIIDNLSIDGTEELVREYMKEAPYEVTYIKEGDNGIYNAMNKGIKASRGQWLIFLGSDDRFASENVIQNTFTSRNDLDAYELIVGGIFCGNDLETAEYRAPYYDEKLKYHAFHHQASFIRSTMFSKYGLYDERFRIAANGVFNAKYYRRANYLLLNYPVAWQLPGGASSGLSIRNMYEYCITAVLYRKFPARMKLSYVVKLVAVIVQEALQWLLRKRAVQPLKKYLKRILRHWPDGRIK